MGKRTPNSICIWCNEGYYNRPSTPDRKTCSKECNSEARKAGLVKSGAEAKTNCICSVCTKDFYMAPSHQLRSKSGKHYCSIACQHEDQKLPVHKECLECGKPFSTTPSIVNRHNYCSTKCGYLAKSKSMSTKIDHTCETCEKTFLAKPNRNRRFCSQDCMFGNEEFTKSMRSMESPNKLEKFFLENTPRRIKFTGDGRIWFTFNSGKRKNPDFVVDYSNKVIELHGDYWHQGEDIDTLVKNYSDIGYDCLVLWESEIRKDWDATLTKVLEFIGSEDE